jgi:prepilin-type N-terminal cleavage/methylation domain-containing protein
MSRGFTFVELIVVLIVLGVSASIVFPKLGGLLLKEAEPWQSGRKLIHVARYAHEWAVSTESSVWLHIDTKTGEYWASDGTAQEETRRKTQMRYLMGRVADEVKITAVRWPEEDQATTDVVMIEFRPDGWNAPVVLEMTSLNGRMVEVTFGERFGQAAFIGEDGTG